MVLVPGAQGGDQATGIRKETRHRS
jgi:hypothetical protein